jgi:hypothetical protein
MHLTEPDDLVQRYAQDGYAILPSVFTPERLRPLQQILDRIQAAPVSPPEVQDDRLVRESSCAIFIIGEPASFDARVAEWLILPELIEPVRRLLRCQDIRLHLSNITTQHPGSGRAIAWHRDYPNRYICPPDSSFLRVMLCLDGMDEENGATRFILGSHRLSDQEATSSKASEGAEHREPVVAACCPSGSLVFIHPKVIHGGQANTSQRPRRNLIVQWGRGSELSGTESLSGFSVDDIRGWIAERALA